MRTKFLKLFLYERLQKTKKCHSEKTAGKVVESAASLNQRWSRGRKARGQGHKKIRGQGQPFRGQTLSRSRIKKTISGRVDRASATETVDSGSIPGRVKQRL